MLSVEMLKQGEHVMTVCNSCRYCEAYCPVFPAMEKRLTFTTGDLGYLANLCHNCGECLYACQYAPPHEFGINVPFTLARLRLETYEQYCWPAPLAAAFRRHSLITALTLTVIFTGVMWGAAALTGGDPWTGRADADFYRVIPHQAMVGLFGAVGLFVAAALLIPIARFWRASGERPTALFRPAAVARAIGDALTLRHLHNDGENCTSSEETRPLWRRWFHHLTMYGFLLCFASTTVAAIYHIVFGWPAPYAYTSLPVVLGTAGGFGLAIGPVGLWLQRDRRDEALIDSAQDGLDRSFIMLLVLASATGLILLAGRTLPSMAALLIVHLAVVLALFVTLPYGKFVHGLYRLAALVKHALETDRPERHL
ncbi:MAG: tcuB [Acidobacteria bacterium]|nr:tcuB [Acidobacteriota bacterium]